MVRRSLSQQEVEKEFSFLSQNTYSVLDSIQIPDVYESYASAVKFDSTYQRPKKPKKNASKGQQTATSGSEKTLTQRLLDARSNDAPEIQFENGHKTSELEKIQNLLSKERARSEKIEQFVKFAILNEFNSTEIQRGFEDLQKNTTENRFTITTI
jgi:hypothetical protein